VAITCTSGTAAANLHPAVVEAHESGVPLLVLTADRPPELREVGAGQAIDQIALFGTAARWFFEVGTHAATPERVRWMRALACRAVAIATGATGGRPGPVHLNVPLREPLVPAAPLAEDPAPGRPDGRPWIAFPHGTQVAAPGLPPARRPLLIVGDLRSPGAAAALALQAAANGWPLLADPMSGARRGEAAIAHYDLLVRDEGFTTAHRPDLVLRVGDLPVSKPLRGWLGTLADVPQLSIGVPTVWGDPAAVIADVLPGDPAALELPPAQEEGWLHSWRRADMLVAAAVDEVLDDVLSEPQVARDLMARLPADATLVVASSMPVRDLEEFTQVRPGPPRVVCNRGANGIDGTVSTAFGVAAATDGPTVLLVGDVALLHDVGGLLAARRLDLSLTIVVLDNDGGGIFEFLPVAGERDVFEEHVATPHGVDLAHAAALYGCAFERPGDLRSLRRAVDASLQRDGATLIVVGTDRAANLALHRRASAAAIGALAA
jgi:2-succinyl-5-enolpyruvyl-6-hydroxy-3-cyclohexene-1-carboxylate synthase